MTIRMLRVVSDTTIDRLIEKRREGETMLLEQDEEDEEL